MIACRACPLGQYTEDNKYFPTPGKGSPKRESLFLIGEAPGINEAKTGIPFVGRSGQLLDRCIVKAHIDPNNIYIANAVKHRPPENRTPTFEELSTCVKHFLEVEIERAESKVIVCLGKTATNAIKLLANQDMVESKFRGTSFKYKNILVISTWHPAYVLRSPDRETELVDDLRRASECLKQALM